MRHRRAGTPPGENRREKSFGGPRVQQKLEEIFATAGCVGTLCVQDAEGRLEVGIDPERPVVAASVIKVLIAVEVERQIADGRLDPTERLRLSAQTRTPGPVGFSLYSDDVEVSLRDLLVPLLTISDNVATDALLARVGITACNATATALGLRETVIECDLRTTIDSIGQAAGFAGWDALVAWGAEAHAAADEEVVQERTLSAPAMQARTANRTTPRDMCRLLRLIWTDQAAPAEGCRRIRGLMARQLTRNRLAAGFPSSARVSAKSGGLLGVYRHEVGVIAYPSGRWYTAAVFTQATDTRHKGEAAINTAIGQAAARAIELLDSASTKSLG